MNYKIIETTNHESLQETMPDCKRELQNQDLILGNFRGLALARMSVNGISNYEHSKLFDSQLLLPGNIVVGDPRNSDFRYMFTNKQELFIVNDLEQAVFSELKNRVLSLNAKSVLDDTYSLPISNLGFKSDRYLESIHLYEFYKKEGRDYITIINPNDFVSLMSGNSEDAENSRRHIMEGLFQGNLKQMNDYMTFYKFMRTQNHIMKTGIPQGKDEQEYFNQLIQIYSNNILTPNMSWIPSGISMLNSMKFLNNMIVLDSSTLTDGNAIDGSKILLVNKKVFKNYVSAYS